VSAGPEGSSSSSVRRGARSTTRTAPTSLYADANEWEGGAHGHKEPSDDDDDIDDEELLAGAAWEVEGAAAGERDARAVPRGGEEGETGRVIIARVRVCVYVCVC
jgi:hypothetical protein